MAKLSTANVGNLKKQSFLSLARISPYYEVLCYCKCTQRLRWSTGVGHSQCGLENFFFFFCWVHCTCV